MTVQPNVSTSIAYKVESAFGTPATNSGAQYVRRVSSTMNTTKDSFASNEVRVDQQISDMRHGMISARGGIEGELSTVTYDDFIEAALRGTWATGVSADPDDFATGVTTAASGATGTFTFAGTGNLITLGFKVGDIVRASGLLETANNAKNFRIVGLTSTVMTVFPAPTADDQQASGWAFAVAGKKLLMGTEKRSFTIEQSYPDIDVSELFTGVRIGGMNIGAQPNGMTTVGFEMLGRKGEVLSGSSSPYFSTPTAQTNTGILSGINGGLRMNGQELGIVTGLTINLSLNLSMQPVIGSVYAPDIFYGRSVVTGQVSAYLENDSLIGAFLNESEIDLVAVLNAAGGDPQDFIAFNMQRVKLGGGQKSIGPDGGVIAQFSINPLLKSGGSGTVYDQSTLVVQRSNS